MKTSQASKLCLQCSTNNPTAAKFCSECGERLAAVSVSSVIPPTRLDASVRTSDDPRAAMEQFISLLDTEKATSQLQTTIAKSRARLKTLGVPLPTATNPILVSLMESLKALPSTEISARIAIVTALGRTCDPAVLPPLLLVTGAQSRDVRKATAIALGSIRHPLSAYLLLPMLQDGSSRVKQAAFQALVQLIQPHTVDAILAACLENKSLRSLILETLRLVRDEKRNAFFQLLGESIADQQPDLKLVADWLRFEFRNAISSESSVSGRGNAGKTQSAPASGAASAHRYSSRTTAAVIKESQTPDHYEMTPGFAEDDDCESDVRLVDDSNDSAPDLDFFNSISDSISDSEYQNGHDDADDLGVGFARNRNSSDASVASPPCLVRADGAARLRRSAAPSADICRPAEVFSVKPNSHSLLSNEREFASNGSQASMSLSGMLAAPAAAEESSHQMTRPAGRHSNNGNRLSARTNHLGSKSAAPAYDITTSSPLIPAFTSSTAQPVAFAATTNAAGKAGCEVTSTDHKSGTASGVTPIVLPGDDEQSIDEIEAAKALARAAHEKALDRLSAAREEAFGKLLEGTEDIPKTLPRLLKKRVSALMATPSTKMDQVIEQLHELGATNSPAALSTLASFCHKPARQVREACAQAIGCIAHPGSAVLLLKLLADKSGTVVEAALKALTKLDLEPTRSVLLAAGLCGTSLRTVVTVGVESTSNDKKSEWETLLLEVLRGDDTNLAAFAVPLLARIAGDTHLEIFQQLASHKAPVLRAAAVEALARTQAKRAISQINDALEDADPTVRAQAAMSVATMYSPRSVELLQKLVFDSNLTVRRNAAQSMSRIDESDLADVIARALDQETDAITVEYLLAAVQRNGANSSLPILQRYIEGESSQFREQAVKALRKLKIPASVPVFRRLLDDHAPALRRQAIEQLAVLKPDGVIPRLREMLKQDPNEMVRSACAKALGDFGDETSVHLLEEALEDHPLVRLQAVIALGRLGQASAGPILLSLMRDQLPEVRYQAVRGIGLLKLEGAVEHVEPLLDDSDELVRRGAEQTLTDLGVKTGNSKARQWKRRVSTAAGWIAPSTLAGLIPGGAKTLFAVILLLASSVGMFAFKGILMAASGEQFEIEPPVSMSVSSSGKNILVVRQFGVSEVWNLESGTLACRQLLPGRVTGGVFVDDASLLINQDGKMVAYDFLDETLKEAGPTLNLPEQITHTVLHRQTKTLFVAYLKENRAHLASYSLQTMKLQSDRVLSKIPGGQLTVSPDGNFVASMSGATVLVYDLKNDQVGEFSFSDLTGGANGGEVLSMCFSDDMKFLAISQSSFGVAVIDMATTSVKARLEPKDSFGYAFVRFAPGSHNLVAVSTGGKVIVSSNEFATVEAFNIEGCRSAIDMFSVSDDNKQLAVASTEELDVFIGDAVTRKVSHQLVAVDNE